MAAGAAFGIYPLTHNKPRNYSNNLGYRGKLREPHSITCTVSYVNLTALHAEPCSSHTQKRTTCWKPALQHPA